MPRGLELFQINTVLASQGFLLGSGQTLELFDLGLTDGLGGRCHGEQHGQREQEILKLHN
ncbi:hypothetical protein [Marinobacter sp. NFXS11]|uniref:hypothetical protein n=1 Tax=Marinobacter sp. NFXS11 TaxID=2818432 RepID=UPI0032DF2EE0